MLSILDFFQRWENYLGWWLHRIGFSISFVWGWLIIYWGDTIKWVLSFHLYSLGNSCGFQKIEKLSSVVLPLNFEGVIYKFRHFFNIIAVVQFFSVGSLDTPRPPQCGVATALTHRGTKAKTRTQNQLNINVSEVICNCFEQIFKCAS